MKRTVRYALLLVASVAASALLPGCATRQEAGALTGAVVGAAAGSTVGRGSGRALAIWLGAVVGSQVGATVGRYMDEQDRMKMSSVLETNKTRAPSTWNNPDSGNRYTVTPTRTYENAQGPCREFTVDAVIGGRVEQVYGTACRQTDGSWKVIK
jgi:surface antigen